MKVSVRSVLHPCSNVFPDKDSMIAGALEIAGEIASRSPVAVQGTKINLLYSRDHSVSEGLDYMVKICLRHVQHYEGLMNNSQTHSVATKQIL